MAEKIWEPLQKAYCDRAQADVLLEAQIVYPAESLPDQPPRVLAHRCSQALECNQMLNAGCTWAGTNPGYDPFAG